MTSEARRRADAASPVLQEAYLGQADSLRLVYSDSDWTEITAHKAWR